MDIIKLNDVCEILNGYAFKSANYVNSGIRIIRITNVQNGYIEDKEPRFYPLSREREIQKYILKENDILISLTGNVGRVALLEKKYLPAALNQRVACLRLKNKIIYKPFLFCFLNSYFFENQCITNSKGIAQLNLSTEWLRDYEIPLYEYKSQVQIADKFHAINKLIGNRKRQLELLDMIVKSRFIEMFGVPGTDDFGWGLASLGDVCKVNPKKGQDQQPNHNIEVSFVPMSAVSEQGTINTTTVKQYDEVKTGFTYFIENDVLFAKITPCMENGKGAVARNLHNGVGFGSTEFHVLRPINGKTNADWIYALTIFHKFRLDASNHMSGSAGQRRVPASFLENYRVSVPPFELQEKFSDFIEKIDKSKFECPISLNLLKLYDIC